MLQSKTTGDVVEALRFFTRAINFKIAGALSLFKSAFSLVWHQDPSIKAEMLLAFSAVYFTDGAGEHAEALAAGEVAHNLMHLVRHCDASEVSVEFCVQLFRYIIELNVCNFLWGSLRT